MIVRFGSLSEESIIKEVSKSQQFRNRIHVIKKEKETQVEENESSDAPG